MSKSQLINLPALVYADLFDYPLTVQELEKYSIVEICRAEKSRHPRGGSVACLHRGSILKKSTIEITAGYYHLPGRESLVTLRQKREKISRQKLIRAKKIALRLSKLPYILGIFVTGNLAMRNAEPADDIDFLIITKTNTLWLTRLLVTFFLEIFGVRRRPRQKDAPNRICANMYLDETALTLPTSKRNLYTAHEVVQVLPLINKNQIYERFLYANSWIKDFLPHFPLPSSGYPEARSSKPVASFLETLAYKFQHQYMRHKITRETVTPHSAFFHPRDTGSSVLNRYQSKLQNYYILST